MKKHRWCAWDANPVGQNGRRRRIHWAMAAPPNLQFVGWGRGGGKCLWTFVTTNVSRMFVEAGQLSPPRWQISWFSLGWFADQSVSGILSINLKCPIYLGIFWSFSLYIPICQRVGLVPHFYKVGQRLWHSCQSSRFRTREQGSHPVVGKFLIPMVAVSFCLFSSFLQYNEKYSTKIDYKCKKLWCCVWYTKPVLRDGRRRRIHGANV